MVNMLENQVNAVNKCSFKKSFPGHGSLTFYLPVGVDREILG